MKSLVQLYIEKIEADYQRVVVAIPGWPVG